VILKTLEIDPADLERETGWAIKPEGACYGEQRCVPLSRTVHTLSGGIDATALAEQLNMPLLHDERDERDEASGLWCLGPEAGGRALATATAPDLVLPDVNGDAFALRSLRGSKILLVAWASW